MASYLGQSPPARPHPISYGNAMLRTRGTRRLMASRQDWNHISRFDAESGGTPSGGLTRLYLPAAPISHCANMDTTAGTFPREAGGRRSAMVPGVSRSDGTANLLAGGWRRRSLYVHPYGRVCAMASAKPRPSQPTQLDC
eukprot:scaffold894_cov130-Isochrysis_galbana.AAC.3